LVYIAPTKTKIKFSQQLLGWSSCLALLTSVIFGDESCGRSDATSQLCIHFINFQQRTNRSEMQVVTMSKKLSKYLECVRTRRIDISPINVS